MAPLDSDAAARAWLARLPADQVAAGSAYTHAEFLAWLVSAALFILACALIGRFDLLGRLARRIEGERPRPRVVAAALGGTLGLILAAVNALTGSVGAWWANERLWAAAGSAPARSLMSRLDASAGAIMPEALAAALLTPLVLWLMRRLPRAWPLIVGAAVTGVLLLVIWLPVATSLGPPTKPAPASATRDGVMRLIAETGIPAREVGLVPSASFDADVTGGFGKAKVSIGPEFLAGPPAEARAFIGHIMGHYAHNDILIACLAMGAIFTVVMFGAQVLAAPLATAIGGRPVAGPSDPRALPALAICFFVAVTASGLASNAYLRWANVCADAYSLDHAREPDGLAAVLEREWPHNALDPNPLEEAIFYSHPPLPGRIRHAMAWKAAHGG